jgi:SAM-dependent methyltransferase
MAQPMRKTNLDTWNKPEVASYYAALNYLTPCEQSIFDEHLNAGMAILDLGVGGGRTSPYLSSLASRYIGADYAEEMVAACRKKFPELEFQTVDAADLSRFASASFDAVVMAFNGIDNVIPDESRLCAWREMHRVLKPKGVLIFSSHNMRSVWVRPSWNPKRLEGIAKRIVGDSILYRPLLGILTVIRAVLAVLQAFGKSLSRVAQRVPSKVFWRGEGYLDDSAHGGATIHQATPEKVEQELSGCGFRRLRILGEDFPLASHLYVTRWYYYAFTKGNVTPLERSLLSAKIEIGRSCPLPNPKLSTCSNPTI